MSVSARSGGETIQLSIELAALIPALAILLCEGLVFMGFIDLAIAGYVITLFAITAGNFYGQEATLFSGFLLIPVFRLVNLGMPLIVETSLLWLPLIYGPFILSGLIVARANPSVELRLGWIAGIGALPIAIAVGAVLAIVEFGILRPPALIGEPAHYVILAVVMTVFVGFVEELLFRGILQPALQVNLGPARGIVLASLVFGMMHAGGSSAGDIGFGIGMGVFLGVLYYRYGSLLMITGIHGVLNVFLFGVFPLEGPFVAMDTLPL